MLLDATRRYSTLLDATRRYSTLIEKNIFFKNENATFFSVFAHCEYGKKFAWCQKVLIKPFSSELNSSWPLCEKLSRKLRHHFRVIITVIIKIHMIQRKTPIFTPKTHPTMISNKSSMSSKSTGKSASRQRNWHFSSVQIFVLLFWKQNVVKLTVNLIVHAARRNEKQPKNVAI
jgi:hypothetical protein